MHTNVIHNPCSLLTSISEGCYPELWNLEGKHTCNVNQENKQYTQKVLSLFDVINMLHVRSKKCQQVIEQPEDIQLLSTGHGELSD